MNGVLAHRKGDKPILRMLPTAHKKRNDYVRMNGGMAHGKDDKRHVHVQMLPTARKWMIWIW